MTPPSDTTNDRYSRRRRWSSGSHHRAVIGRFRVPGRGAGETSLPTSSDWRVTYPTDVAAVRLASDVKIQLRPIVEGQFIEVREVLISPRYPRDVRFLQDVCVPVLLRQVEAYTPVAEIMTAYLSAPEGRHCRPETIRQVLARLYQEHLLVAVEE